MSTRLAIIYAILSYMVVGILVATIAPKFFMLLIPILCLDIYLSQKRFNIFGKGSRI